MPITYLNSMLSRQWRLLLESTDFLCKGKVGSLPVVCWPLCAYTSIVNKRPHNQCNRPQQPTLMLSATLRGQGLWGAGAVRRATAAVACASSFSSSSCCASSDTRSSCFFRSSYLQGNDTVCGCSVAAAKKAGSVGTSGFQACIQAQKLTTALLAPTTDMCKHRGAPWRAGLLESHSGRQLHHQQMQHPGRVADAGMQQVC